MDMFIALISLILGLCILVLSAQKLVHNAIIIGNYHRWSEFMIGITIIGIGTSLPEIMVSILAALKGNPHLALGNGYGSNIANLLLILGASLTVCQIEIPKSIWKGELSWLVIASIITLGILISGTLDRIYGMCALALYLWIIYQALNNDSQTIAQPQAQIKRPYALAWILVCLSFAILMGSAQMLVWSATYIAHKLNIGDEIIGLTIVAIGTSLPELATSLAACQNKKTNLILGNIIGSNLLNTLVVIGVAAFIHPIEIHQSILMRDFSLMLIATLYLWLRCYTQKPKYFTHIEGILLLLIYGGYLSLLAKHIVT